MSSPRRVRHVVRGTTYFVVGSFPFDPQTPIAEGDIVYVGGITAELQASGGDLRSPVMLVVYEAENAPGKRWCRAEAEFNDGRFEEI